MSTEAATGQQDELHPHANGTSGAWVAVTLMVLGVTGVTVALPLSSWPLAGISLGTGAAGIIVGKLVNIMDQVH